MKAVGTLMPKRKEMWKHHFSKKPKRKRRETVCPKKSTPCHKLERYM